MIPYHCGECSRFLSLLSFLSFLEQRLVIPRSVFTLIQLYYTLEKLSYSCHFSNTTNPLCNELEENFPAVFVVLCCVQKGVDVLVAPVPIPPPLMLFPFIPGNPLGPVRQRASRNVRNRWSPSEV